MSRKMAGEDEAWAEIARLRAAIVEHYLPWAQRCVEKLCARRGIPHMEVEGAGGTGLLRAVARFDLARGKRFAMFALKHVYGAALDMARKNDPRQFAHGTKPSYQMMPLSEAMEQSMSAAAESKVDLAAVDGLLSAVTDRAGRELFVRCSLAEEALDDAAAALMMPVVEAQRALKLAVAEAKEHALNAGMVSHVAVERAEGARAAVARRRRLMPLAKLREMAAEALRPGKARKFFDADAAEHVLTGVCQWCGIMVVGRRAVRGPMTAECPQCHRKVEVG